MLVLSVGKAGRFYCILGGGRSVGGQVFPMALVKVLLNKLGNY